MKIFRAKDGRVLQLADKRRMKDWDAQMPLLYIGTLREKRIPEYRQIYSKQLVKEVEDYVEEILEKIAIPKLIQSLSSNDVEARRKVAESFLELSKNNPDQLKIALSHIKEAQDDPNKAIAKMLKEALKNYDKAQRRKRTVSKRKKLTALRRKMDGIDRDYADGNLSDEEYLQEQKAYLKLKREIELEEESD